MSITLEQISKHYDGTPVVSDVSVNIADGELFVLLGPSGSGKSTLLRAIAGLTTIDHGRIVLHGRDVTHVGAREREVGFVFQNYALFRHMTVADNIEFALRARRIGAAARRKRRLELLKLVALEGFGNRLPSELSGGQQQRVAVARALAHEPRVLLLDEPFGALDAKIRDELRRSIRDIQRKVGITTILVTHDQEEAFSMADRIGVMDRGRLQDADSPRELYTHPRTRFVATFLGVANLLLGRHERGGVRVGESVFDFAQWPLAPRLGAETTVVIRPEDVTVVRSDGALPLQPLGVGRVAEVEYVGSIERLRVAVERTDGLTSAVRPEAAHFTLDAARDARDAEAAPLGIGQAVALGAKRVHVLPTPISSLRLIGADDAALNRLSTSVLIRELAARMHIAPLRYEERKANLDEAMQGLPVVALEGRPLLGGVLRVLEQGAQQTLAIGRDERRVERLLIYTHAGRAVRDATLGAAGTLLRHLAVDATMLVPDDARLLQGPYYRDLLDLRDSALRLHGVDVRTETMRGRAADALAQRLRGGEPTLILIGLPSLAAGRDLLDALGSLFEEQPPVGVLIVCPAAELQRAEVSPFRGFAVSA